MLSAARLFGTWSWRPVALISSTSPQRRRLHLRPVLQEASPSTELRWTIDQAEGPGSGRAKNQSPPTVLARRLAWLTPRWADAFERRQACPSANWFASRSFAL